MIHEAKYLAKNIEDLSYAQKKKEYRKRILLDKWGEDLGHKVNIITFIWKMVLLQLYNSKDSLVEIF